jgi:hypothetical protein
MRSKPSVMIIKPPIGFLPGLRPLIPSSVRSVWPLSKSQSRSVWSHEPDTAWRPSAVTATALTQYVWPSSVRSVGVWGATEQKTGLSTGCRQPLDRRDVNIERLGAVPYILSLVQLVELPGRPNCTSRFLATLRARVGCASVPARLSSPGLGQSSCTIFAQVLAKRLGFARYCCEREFPSLGDPIQCLSVS